MKRLQQVLGMPVFRLENGAPVGRVFEILYGENHRSLGGIHVMRQGLQAGRRLYPIEQVTLIGEVSLLVRGKGLRIKKETLSRKALVLTPEGDCLGQVTDALFDEQSRRIEQLEISLGVFEDLLFGRQWMKDYHSTQDGIVISDGSLHASHGEMKREDCDQVAKAKVIGEGTSTNEKYGEGFSHCGRAGHGGGSYDPDDEPADG